LGLLVGILGGGKALWDLMTGQALSGFTTVILLQIIFGSLILVVLGLLGQYLGRIYEELKARPIYVLKPQWKPHSKPYPHESSVQD
jgi:dolichol-phosphate mannosyltransferase